MFRWLLYENGVALPPSEDSETVWDRKRLELFQLEDTVEMQFVRCFWRTVHLAEQGARYRTMRGVLCVPPILIQSCVLLALEILSQPSSVPTWRLAPRPHPPRPGSAHSDQSSDSGLARTTPSPRPLQGLPGWEYYASLCKDPHDQDLAFTPDTIQSACFRLVQALESYDTDLRIIEIAAKLRTRVEQFFAPRAPAGSNEV